jgi:hypothetical protein
MTDPISYAATLLHISPSALPLILFAIYLVAKATSRLIPDNATGWKAVVRNVAGVISVDISSRIAPGVTIADVAKAAATTPPIPQKIVAAETEGT